MGGTESHYQLMQQRNGKVTTSTFTALSSNQSYRPTLSADEKISNLELSARELWDHIKCAETNLHGQIKSLKRDLGKLRDDPQRPTIVDLMSLGKQMSELQIRLNAVLQEQSVSSVHTKRDLERLLSQISSLSKQFEDRNEFYSKRDSETNGRLQKVESELNRLRSSLDKLEDRRVADVAPSTPTYPNNRLSESLLDSKIHDATNAIYRRISHLESESRDNSARLEKRMKDLEVSQSNLVEDLNRGIRGLERQSSDFGLQLQAAPMALFYRVLHEVGQHLPAVIHNYFTSLAHVSCNTYAPTSSQEHLNSNLQKPASPAQEREIRNDANPSARTIPIVLIPHVRSLESVPGRNVERMAAAESRPQQTGVITSNRPQAAKPSALTQQSPIPESASAHKNNTMHRPQRLHKNSPQTSLREVHVVQLSSTETPQFVEYLKLNSDIHAQPISLQNCDKNTKKHPNTPCVVVVYAASARWFDSLKEHQEQLAVLWDKYGCVRVAVLVMGRKLQDVGGEGECVAPNDDANMIGRAWIVAGKFLCDMNKKVIHPDGNNVDTLSKFLENLEKCFLSTSK